MDSVHTSGGQLVPYDLHTWLYRYEIYILNGHRSIANVRDGDINVSSKAYGICAFARVFKTDLRLVKIGIDIHLQYAPRRLLIDPDTCSGANKRDDRRDDTEP